MDGKPASLIQKLACAELEANKTGLVRCGKTSGHFPSVRCRQQVLHWSLITSDLVPVTRVSLSLLFGKSENKGQGMNV